MFKSALCVINSGLESTAKPGCGMDVQGWYSEELTIVIDSLDHCRSPDQKHPVEINILLLLLFIDAILSYFLQNGLGPAIILTERLILVEFIYLIICHARSKMFSNRCLVKFTPNCLL